MRLYNIAHKGVGKILKQGDSFTIVIPPIGEYVEFDDKHRRKAELLVEKTFHKLSLTPVRGLNEISQQNIAILDLQSQLRQLQEENERLKNQQDEDVQSPVTDEVTATVAEEVVTVDPPDDGVSLEDLLREQVETVEETKGRGRPKKESN